MSLAVVPLWLLLPGVFTLSGAKILTSYLSGIGKPIYATWIAGGGLVLTVILDLFLIPRFGIAGAAAASSIVYTLTAAACIYCFRLESGAGILETVIVQPQDFAYYRRAATALFSRLGAPVRAKPPA
jgi:Na+-driven multidrug efflux pump